jgi:peptidoglycan-N-acetylglucosamine deacetylase
MSPTRPLASLSLDLDNKWSYLKTHGDPGWQSFPTYLPLVVPRFLNFLQARNLSITVFVVGQDAVLPKNQATLRSIGDAGHEIGNHSFHHEPWLHLYSEAEAEHELARAEEGIQRATGQRPVGFRGPGYSLSPTILRILTRRGYRYDASTLPTFIGPLARAYYFMTARLSGAEMRRRKILFGTVRDGLRSVKPYRWQTDAGSLLEIPVTTLPLSKTPVHFSYLLYLSLTSEALALSYFRTALRLCRLTGTSPSLLLHPLDFLGGDDVEGLSFFPAMGMRGEKKVALVAALIDLLREQFTVVPMRHHAQEIARAGGLPLRNPRFR